MRPGTPFPGGRNRVSQAYRFPIGLRPDSDFVSASNVAVVRNDRRTRKRRPQANQFSHKVAEPPPDAAVRRALQDIEERITSSEREVMSMNRPIRRFRAAPVSASVFANEVSNDTPPRVMYSVTLQQT